MYEYVGSPSNNQSERSVAVDNASSSAVGAPIGDSPPAIHTSSDQGGFDSQSTPRRKRRNDEAPVFETIREVRMTRADMVSMYGCMYVCMAVMYLCMYGFMYVCMYVCMYVYFNVCMYACVYVLL